MKHEPGVLIACNCILDIVQKIKDAISFLRTNPQEACTARLLQLAGALGRSPVEDPKDLLEFSVFQIAVAMLAIEEGRAETEMGVGPNHFLN